MRMTDRLTLLDLIVSFCQGRRYAQRLGFWAFFSAKIFILDPFFG